MVGKEYRRGYLAFAVAYGAVFVGHDVEGRAHTVAGNLHEAELAERQYVVPGPVALHQLFHAFVEFLPVLGIVHVDVVDDDDAAHIAQPQLAGYLFGGGHVYLEGGVFLVGIGFGAVAAVDVDDVESLGVFDDEVGSVAERDGLTERRFDLLRDGKVVEDGNIVGVEFDDVFALGSNDIYIVVDVLESLGVVDVDIFKRGVENIAPAGLRHGLSLRR